MNKPARLTKAIAKRINQSGGQQDRRGPCLICNHSFNSCPHGWGEVEKMVRASELAEVLGVAP